MLPLHPQDAGLNHHSLIPSRFKVSALNIRGEQGGPSFSTLAIEQKKAIMKRIKDYREDRNNSQIVEQTSNSQLS